MGSASEGWHRIKNVILFIFKFHRLELASYRSVDHGMNGSEGMHFDTLVSMFSTVAHWRQYNGFLVPAEERNGSEFFKHESHAPAVLSGVMYPQFFGNNLSIVWKTKLPSKVGITVQPGELNYEYE